jgi:hypothetical protein
VHASSDRSADQPGCGPPNQSVCQDTCRSFCRFVDGRNCSSIKEFVDQHVSDQRNRFVCESANRVTDQLVLEIARLISNRGGDLLVTPRADVSVAEVTDGAAREYVRALADSLGRREAGGCGCKQRGQQAGRQVDPQADVLQHRVGTWSERRGSCLFSDRSAGRSASMRNGEWRCLSRRRRPGPSVN